MNNYFTFKALLGINSGEQANLPLFKDARFKRYESVSRMLDLLDIASKTRPWLPKNILFLDATDPEWDDIMPFPVIDRSRYGIYAAGITSLLFFYSYNYNIFTTNIRFRTFRNIFPIFITYLFVDAYSSYRKQILKTNIFDEYCYLRAHELVEQNSYLLEHESVTKAVWWGLDFRQTLEKVYRQANNNHASDFADSQLIIQDFINRYVDPNAKSPMKNFTRII